jgi:putative transposase
MDELAATVAQSGGSLAVTRRCRVLALGRALYYRRQTGQHKPAPDAALRDQLQRVALEWPAYGYRRITAELQRRGLAVNHKRVLRLMREDNLLGLRKRKFIRTTDAHHRLLVYPNLVPALAVSGPNQLWVADITYSRLQREYIYLAVLLDAWSRRCIE